MGLWFLLLNLLGPPQKKLIFNLFSFIPSKESGYTVTELKAGRDELQEALEDIDAYLETMPPKTDNWSIGYEAITPFVKSLRILRNMWDVRMLTDDEAAVARIACTRLANDIKRMGGISGSPDVDRILPELRVKLARFFGAAVSQGSPK